MTNKNQRAASAASPAKTKHFRRPRSASGSIMKGRPIVEPDCECISCASADDAGRKLGAPRPDDNDVTRFIRSLRPATRNSPGMVCGLIRVREDGTDELLSVTYVPRVSRGSFEDAPKAPEEKP